MSTFIEIIEQPISSIRFRYESERRWNDNLIGQHSTSRTRTYPMVRVNGYPGNEDLIIEASCVSAEGPPYKTHPFKLLGHNCQDGICWAEVDKLTGIATFSKLSVQCVTVKQIPDSLKLREYRNVDPFNQKFHHAANPKSIDTKKIKLCFRLFRKNKEEPICAPIVSNVIHSQVSVHDDLKIVFLGSKSAPMGQEQEMTLFCNKLKDDNIAITLFRGKPGEPDYWQAYANIILIHMKVAIAFKTPIYTGKLEANDKPVKVYIQMCNPLDGSFSNVVPFHFVPNHSIPRSPNGPTIVRNPMPQIQSNTDRVSSSIISSTTPSSAIHRPYLHDDDIAYCWRELSTMRQMYMDMLKFLTLSTQKRSQSRYSPY